MNFTLGMYTQITQSSPAPAVRRVLSCLISPTLTFLHNNPDCALAFSPCNALIRYLSQYQPEINLLIQSLVKKDRMELFTSSYNQTILSLVPHKDRSALIDKNTTIIRKTYGVRCTSLWCYGQIWSASYINTMKLIGLDRVVISAYDAIAKKVVCAKPFKMYELGKSVDVIPSRDEAARLVSSYAQNEITLTALIEGLNELLSSSEEDIVFMINLDQLCQGASFNREDDERLFEVFISLFLTAREKGIKMVLPSTISVSGPGYLHDSWYGRDASADGLTSFNDLFVKNACYRWYLRRVNALSELASECKKDRSCRKAVQDLLSSIPSGPMFICDTQASALSLEEHRHYYRTLLDAEERLGECGLKIVSADINGDGLDEEFCYGKVNSAVFSRLGASVLEYNLADEKMNIFDAVSPWRKTASQIEKPASFTDMLTLNSETFDLGKCVFELESVNRSRTDFNFSYETGELEILKHYKLTNQNLYLSLNLVNSGDEAKEGVFSTSVYFSMPEASAFAFDSKRELLVGRALSSIKSVRFSAGDRQRNLIFTSTEFFDAVEETKYQSEITSLGSQQFYLYTKVQLTFKISIEAHSVKTFNIITRMGNQKEKIDVYSE